MQTQLSWEEIINQVTIASNFRNVEQAGRNWTSALGGGVALIASLEELRRKSAEWQGGGADACRRHLDDLKKSVARNIDDHQDVGSVLLRCSEHLKNAVSSIPIPHWRYDEVLAAHQDFHDQGVFRGLQDGSIWADIRNWVADTAPRIGIADIDDWIAKLRYDYSVGERKAQEVYAALCRAYDVEFDRLPAGTPVAVPAVATGGKGGGPGAADRKPTAQQPGQQSAQQMAQQVPNTTPTTTVPPTGTVPDLTTPDLTAPDLTVPDPDDLSDFPGTGLAGVTPSDLGGGLDPQGLGGGGGLKGVGGLGKDAMGPAFSLPSADAMTGGRGGVGARIPGGGGGATPTGMMGGGMGMMPGGMGAGMQSANGAHTSPLHEQDDVWGIGETRTPGVIDV